MTPYKVLHWITNKKLEKNVINLAGLLGDNREMWLGLQFYNQYDWNKCLEWYDQTCIRYGRKYHWVDGTEYQDIETAALNTNGRDRFVLNVESSGGKQIKGVDGNTRRKYACVTICEGKLDVNNSSTF